MKLYLHQSILLLIVAVTAVSPISAQARAKAACPEESPHFNSAAFDSEPVEIIPPAEKAIASDARPTVSFCVSDGSVRVRGWQRSEIRALVENGKVGFKVQRRNAENAASWVMLLGFDPKEAAKPDAARRDECLSGSDIEIEVPYGAFVDIKSRDGDLKIESISKTRVQSVNGNVFVSDIREDAEVSTLSGNVVAEDSTGKIRLKSFSGNVFGVRLKPLGDSDALNARSESGNVTLQDVSHASIEAVSSNSNLNYFGTVVAGGVYNFNTVSGGINLFLPLQSSFQINATSNTPLQLSFPIKTTMERKPNQIPRIVGTYGGGDATINLVSFGGALRLQKQQ